jgi:hypothetical protein
MKFVVVVVVVNTKPKPKSKTEPTTALPKDGSAC